MRNRIDRYVIKGVKPRPIECATEPMGNKRLPECEWCGSCDYLVHHKDCDRLNNVDSNLMFLCKNCHSHWHQLFPNLRYLHISEIKEIIKMCQAVLDKPVDISRVEIETFVKPIITAEEQMANELREKEETRLISEDYKAHPLPY